MIRYVLYAIAAAAALFAVAWAWQEYIRGPYVEEGRHIEAIEIGNEIELRFGQGVRTPVDAAAVLKRSSDSIKAMRDAAAKRSKASADALARVQTEKLQLEAALEQERNAKPAFPEDPCRSACVLLRSPL